MLVATAIVVLAACRADDVEDIELVLDEQVVPVADGFGVTVTGARPAAPVRVWSRLVDDLGRAWIAWGDFVADEQGRVDPKTTAPRAGTWSGRDAAGLAWSMRLPDGVTADPPEAVLDGPTYTVDVGVDIRGRTVATTRVTRVVHDPELRAVPVDEDGLVGRLHLPPADGPVPGVVLLGGSEGGVPDATVARALASEGFAVLALAYFAEPGLPDALVEIPVEYAVDALDWLVTHPTVADGPIGLVGVSKGGEYALLVAAASDRVGAVAAVVPSGYAFAGLPDLTDGTAEAPAEPVSSWTRAGEPVAFLPPVFGGRAFVELAAAAALGRPIRVAETYAHPLEHTSEEERRNAEIAVEATRASVLLLSADDDGVWPSERLARIAEERLLERGAGDRVEHVTYPDAGHGILAVPGLPTTYRADPFLPGIWLDGGGRPAADAAAATDAWRRALDHLASALAVEEERP